MPTSPGGLGFWGFEGVGPKEVSLHGFVFGARVWYV